MPHTFHIAIWFALPALTWIVTLCFPRRMHPALICTLCLVTIIAGNFVLVNHVRALDAYLLAEVGKHAPGSPEAQRASDEWASDTGRSFALAFSAPLTAILYTVQFMLLFGGRWILGQLSPARSTTANSRTGSQSAELQSED